MVEFKLISRLESSIKWILIGSVLSVSMIAQTPCGTGTLRKQKQVLQHTQ